MGNCTSLKIRCFSIQFSNLPSKKEKLRTWNHLNKFTLKYRKITSSKNIGFGSNKNTVYSKCIYLNKTITAYRQCLQIVFNLTNCFTSWTDSWWFRYCYIWGCLDVSIAEISSFIKNNVFHDMLKYFVAQITLQSYFFSKSS